MSSEWRSGKLGEFIELKRGYDLPKAKRISGAVPLVSSSGVSDFLAEAMVKGPGVITGRYGTIGQVYFVEQDFWPLNTTLYVRDFKGNDPKFVHYFLKTVDFLGSFEKRVGYPACWLSFPKSSLPARRNTTARIVEKVA
jgi:type I restriction enzyme S subunit